MKVRIIIISMAVAFSAFLVSAQSTPVAFVKSVKGKAEVKDKRKSTSRKLKKKELYAGQRVRCSRRNGCKRLKISYCNAPPKSIDATWTRIIRIPCNSLGGRNGGEDKSGGPIIISPKNSEVIRLESFFFKWRPTSSCIKFDLRLRVNLGKEIWSEKGIDGNKGSYESENLRNALKKAQLDGEFSFTITLTETKTKENEKKVIEPQSVDFTLISIEEELKLSNAMKDIDQEKDEIIRTIGRALTYGEYELYADAAKEMEKALSLSRKKNMLKTELFNTVRLATKAHYQAFNKDRTKQLCEILKISKQKLPEYACPD